MSSDPVTPPPHDRGLPPVQPPSGRMFLQLFLVPGLIVAVLVGLFLVGPSLLRLVGGLLGRSPADARSAGEFLRELDSPNPDVRYRAASDLAQVLLRKDELAADPDFALALADRLAAARKRMAEPEKEFAAYVEKFGPQQREAEQNKLAAEAQKLTAERNFSMFLAACLGNCMVPVGVPLLSEMAAQQTGMEDDALAEQRRRALFALANLGQNLTRFDKLSDAQKDEIERRLEAATRTGQAARAQPALDYLRQRRAGKADTLGVAKVLAECAKDDDPSLREYAAFTSNFWSGTTAEDRAIEAMLAVLSEDNGRGENRLAARTALNPNAQASRPVTTRPGFGVQANATVALARRGSPRVRLDVLCEMLDLEALGKLFIVRQRDGSEGPDEAKAAQTVLAALKATAELAKKRPEMKARLKERLGGHIEALTGDGRRELSEAAEAARRAVGEG